MGGAPAVEWIGAGVGFEPGAAASFRRFISRLGRFPDVNRTYADYATQLRMYNAWQAWVSGRGPKPDHSRALHPDYSMHCRGLAWDTDDWRTPGFIALAAEYGWIRTAASDPTEQHHFEYQSWRDQHRNEPAPVGRTAVIPPIGDDTMYIKALNGGAWARAGVIYSNDIGGHWRGLTNLEGSGYVLPLVAQGKLPYAEFNGTDVDILFAVNGVWEQATIDSNTAPRWGARPGTPLMGLGALTGKLMYPGQDSWHYPITQTPPDVQLAEASEPELSS